MKQWIAVAAMVGVVGVVGCKRNTPPPAPQAAAEIQPVTPPPYIPPAQPAPVTVTPVEPAPVVAPEPPPPAPRAAPAPRPAATPAPTPAASSAIRPGSTYTVQRGDTLSQIAVRAYGRGNTAQNVAAIKRANNLKSDMIRVGQKLRIPPRTSGNKD